MEQESLLTDIEFTPVLASIGQRFVNYIIDIIIFDIISSLTERIFTLSTTEFYLPDSALGDFIVFFGWYASFIMLYFVSEMVFKGRTIGKFVTGTRAVNEDGSEMKPSTILIRSLCRMVPFEPFSAFGRRPWHDAWSRTYVIDIKKTSSNSPYTLQ